MVTSIMRKPVCLSCGAEAAVPKEYNLRLHYKTYEPKTRTSGRIKNCSMSCPIQHTSREPEPQQHKGRTHAINAHLY